MTSSNPPLDHHYIPQFLLKEWTVDGELYRYTEPFPGRIICDRKPTKATGFERRLYEMPLRAPEHRQEVESVLMSYIDTRAADAHKRLLKKEKFHHLDADQRSAWITFILSLTLRTPHSFRAYIAGVRAIYERHPLIVEVQKQYEEFKGPDDPLTYQEYLAINDPVEPEKAAFGMLPDVIQNKELGQYIIGMGWSVLEIRSGSFLISDEPVLISNGIAKSDGYIAMPISPTKLFLATNSGLTHARFQKLEGELVEVINKKIVERAKLFVVAHDTKQEAFIQSHFGREPIDSVIQLFEAMY